MVKGFLELGKFPTRVHEIPRAARALGIPGSLWVKREDEAGEPYGGNKVRKLGFIIWDAMRDDAKSMLLLAPFGSNCAVALSSYAPRFGLIPFIVFVNLWGKGIEGSAIEKADLCRSLGARTFLAYRISELPVKLAMALREARGMGKTFLVPPGATSPSSILGYVMAAGELSSQIGAGIIPEPDFIFVPVGSGGTLSGLAIGCRIFGLKSKLIGISAARGPLTHPLRISMLINSGYGEVKRRGLEMRGWALDKLEIRISNDFVGTGYGIPTEEGERMIGILRDEEGILLDRTYTSKAFAGMAYILRRLGGKKTVSLFISTYSPMPWEVA
jgi:D-cysteine desulfhydrase